MWWYPFPCNHKNPKSKRCVAHAVQSSTSGNSFCIFTFHFEWINHISGYAQFARVFWYQPLHLWLSCWRGLPQVTGRAILSKKLSLVVYLDRDGITNRLHSLSSGVLPRTSSWLLANASYIHCIWRTTESSTYLQTRAIQWHSSKISIKSVRGRVNSSWHLLLLPKLQCYTSWRSHWIFVVARGRDITHMPWELVLRWGCGTILFKAQTLQAPETEQLWS